eukprot:1140485-Pelagomonas_calceolata.AAC.7
MGCEVLRSSVLDFCCTTAAAAAAAAAKRTGFEWRTINHVLPQAYQATPPQRQQDGLYAVAGSQSRSEVSGESEVPSPCSGSAANSRPGSSRSSCPNSGHTTNMNTCTFDAFSAVDELVL